MTEPQWSIQAPPEEGAPFLLYRGVLVGRLYGGAPIRDMLRLLNADDAAALSQARAAFRMGDEGLLYEHTDGEVCCVDISCPSLRDVLESLLFPHEEPS